MNVGMPLDFIWEITILNDFVADIKPFFWLFIYIALTDVIVKIPVANLIATFVADVIATECVRWK